MIAFIMAPLIAAGASQASRLIGKLFLATTVPETVIRKRAKRRNHRLDLPVAEMEYLEEKQRHAQNKEEFKSIEHKLEQLTDLMVLNLGDDLPKEVMEEFAGSYFLTDREAAGLYNTLCIRQLGFGVGKPTRFLKEIRQKTGLSEEEILSTLMMAGGNSDPTYLRKISAARLEDAKAQGLLKKGKAS